MTSSSMTSSPAAGRASYVSGNHQRKTRVKLWDPFLFDEKGSKTLYYTIDERDDEDPNHEYSSWHILPDLILEQVFQYLSLEERHSASQKLLDHHRATLFLTKKGEHIRSLIIKPMNNLFNLYEFLNISYYLNDKFPSILGQVHTLRFHFECHIAERSEEVVFGTGGLMLSMFKRVLGILPALKTLEIKDLLLNTTDGLQLLDDVCVTCCETLQTLILINITKVGLTLLHPGVFINLRTLAISPQNISEELLQLLEDTALRNLFIIQNKYTENCRSISYKAWRQCRQKNPKLRVHLCIEGNSRMDIVHQLCAPVKSIVYDSPYARITTSMMLTNVEFYKHDLEVFAHKQLPRFYMPRSFHDRIDSSLLLLVRQCPYIHTLAVREKVSTATVLLIAHSAKNLQFFYVRRNAILLKADWPMNPNWTPVFYTWLCKSALSYEAMECEVSQILGYRWQALTDKQFKNMQINLEKTKFMYS
ncbi:uncharacterized protein [Procambarus clarkii]|uniref:uncharacterized protein isoform X2 n=1 Tax=Procambarus clarkii TaxID=6728 RepID=UPI001E671287|nr:uncharacterized protein LOC123756784 isoform X2 [Procambarus clarkii]